MNALAVESMLYFLNTKSETLPGAGTNETQIDMPVRREASTGNPIIDSSVITGALIRKNPGVSMERAAQAVTDFKLFSIPVRSVPGVFSQVTTASILRNLAEEIEQSGGSSKLLRELWNKTRTMTDKEVRCSCGKVDKIYLAGICFECYSLNISVPKLLGGNKLMIVSEAIFRQLVISETVVVQRNRLDKNKKSINVFNKEYLPEAVIFYGWIHGFRGVEKLFSYSDHLTVNKKTIYSIGADTALGKGMITLQRGDVFWNVAE